MPSEESGRTTKACVITAYWSLLNIANSADVCMPDVSESTFTVHCGREVCCGHLAVQTCRQNDYCNKHMEEQRVYQRCIAHRILRYDIGLQPGYGALNYTTELLAHVGVMVKLGCALSYTNAVRNTRCTHCQETQAPLFVPQDAMCFGVRHTQVFCPFLSPIPRVSPLPCVSLP